MYKSTLKSYKKKRRVGFWFWPVLLAALIGIALLVYQIPRVNKALSWRIEYTLIYINGILHPVEALPTALADDATVYPTSTPLPTSTPQPPTATPEASPTATPQPTPIPGQANLPAPTYEKEDLNNCGPATLAMYLHFYGWKGNQHTISDVIKPIPADRNVNVEELVAYINTNLPSMQIEYRVGGSLDMLREILAAGYPVMIEGSFHLQKSFWPNDDLWAGHYLLLTGYDDAKKEFIVQDSELGPNQHVPYDALNEEWRIFNHVFIMVFPPDKAPVFQSILGSDWDRDTNRQHALDATKAITESTTSDAFAWFNYGTNLVYFDRYAEAVQAYDQARKIGLPQRMLRYQFGPFIAYFNTGRIDDLLSLTDYALQRTPNSEEALLWRGWAFYRQGKSADALRMFNEALKNHPNYSDALYAINFVQSN